MSRPLAAQAAQDLEKAVASMCAQLNAEIASKQEQLRVLRAIDWAAPQVVTGDFVLGLYMVLPSAADVAVFVNERGWRVPGVKATREMTTADVFKLLRSEQCSIPAPQDAALMGMALQKLAGRGGWMPPKR